MINRFAKGSVATVQEIPGLDAIRVKTRFARAGRQKYLTADGKVRWEYRSPEALLETVKLLKDMPVVVEHPGSGRINSKNWNALVKGHVSEVDPELTEHNGHLWATGEMVINDPDTITALRNKTLGGTSLGQLVNPLEFKGPGKDPRTGEYYHAEQPPGIPNHMAIVVPENPRAGVDCRALMDSLDEQIDSKEETPTMELQELMEKVGRLEEKNSRLESEKAALVAERDSAVERADAADVKVAELQGKHDEVVSRLDSVDVDKIAQEELDFRDKMRGVLPENYEFKGKTKHQVRLDSVKHLGGDLGEKPSDEALDAYILARVDSKSINSSGNTKPAVKSASEIRAAKRAEYVKGAK